MDVVFGMAVDGTAHPAHPGPGSGAVGRAVLGPVGFLDLLAGQLGLAGPPIPPVVRIAAWQSKLEEAAASAPRFYSESLSVDPFSTARLLLSWRDDLVDAGWVPRVRQGETGRVADLSAAELSTPALPRGRSDLMRQVRASLAAGSIPDLDRIAVIESPDLLPPTWRRLLRALSDAGVAVGECPTPGASSRGGDLGRVQRFLSEGVVDPLVGDGSLTLLVSRTAITAAEAVADIVAQDVGRDGETVFVVPDGDGGLIDLALARRGLASSGASPRSPRRGALQLLSLAFSMVWAPFDPRRLLDLLLLPRPPIDPWAARLLSDALCREPGVGGTAWEQAWEAIHAELRDRHGDQLDGRSAEDWRSWTEVGSHDRATGIPVSEATATCARVRRWASSTDDGTWGPLLVRAVDAADALSDAFGALRRSRVLVTQVDAMIDAAVAGGLSDPARFAQEGSARCVSRPGAIWGRAEHVVWWGFSGVVPTPRRPWTAGELATLAADGCALESDSDSRRREVAHWERAVRAAGSSLVLVTPALDRGVDATGHPLAHRLGPMLAGACGTAVRVDADALPGRGALRLGAREVRRDLVAGVPLPAPRSTWALPTTLVAAVEGRVETASSLQDLLECQFRWLLRHVARLRARPALLVAEPDRLIGNVAHVLAEEVFRVGVVPDPAQVRRAAAERIDELVDRIAAPLRLPGSSRELAFARVRVPDSLAAVALILSERRLSVVGVEVWRGRTFGPLSVRSRIDMVVRGPDGAEAVIDLKWTRSATRRRREIEEGRAVQLATCGRLVAPAGGTPAAYFLLRQRELLTEAGPGSSSEGLVVGRGLDETWDAVAEDWAALAGAARSGRGLATGVAGVAEHIPANLRFPPAEGVCAHCDMRAVCRTDGEV